MKKYFYTNGIDKIGPFTIQELKEQKLTRGTKIWFYGLENWTSLSEIDEFNDFVNSIPPAIDINKTSANNLIKKKDAIQKYRGNKKNKLGGRKIVSVIGITIIAVVVLLFIILLRSFSKGEDKLYEQIRSSAYETDVDFNFYVEKFYRDIGNYGLFPKKPRVQIIKFAKLDQIYDATHIHGVSYGRYDDDRIEIYINPTTWESFNKPKRYFLMYHELAHDVLNLDDLENLSIHEGKLMYPAIHTYEIITMDEFIESSHTLFEEIAN